MFVKVVVRNHDLFHTALKWSAIPLRHGSRSGMNRGVIPRSRHIATIGETCFQAGGIPPRKLVWLSNWPTVCSQIHARAPARTGGRSSMRMVLPTRCAPTSMRFIAWKRAAPSSWRGPTMSIWWVVPGSTPTGAVGDVLRNVASPSGCSGTVQDPFDGPRWWDIGDTDSAEFPLDRQRSASGPRVGDQSLAGLEDQVFNNIGLWLPGESPSDSFLALSFLGHFGAPRPVNMTAIG